MLPRVYRTTARVPLLVRWNSDLLAAIKNQEQGIYEPAEQKEIKLDPDEPYLQKVGPLGIGLSGIQSTPDQVPIYKDSYAHHNDTSILHSEHIMSPYADMHKIEEEEYMHDEPYGYILGDDPFERHSTDNEHGMRLLAAYYLIVIFILGSRVDGRPRRYALKFAHAFLTAGLLENEMRKVRAKEWAIRDKIAEVDKALSKL